MKWGTFCCEETGVSGVEGVEDGLDLLELVDIETWSDVVLEHEGLFLAGGEGGAVDSQHIHIVLLVFVNKYTDQ